MAMYGTFLDIFKLSTIDEEDEDGNNGEAEEENFVLTALMAATEEGDLEGIKELLEEASNFDINQANKHGETALHMAASGGYIDIMEYLQSKDIQLDVQDRHGDNAVYWAARQGHVDVIQFLKQQGVSLNTQNKAGEAALHVAARYGHTDVVEYLCTHGADVNLQDKLGETCLHMAAWYGLPAAICDLVCSSGCKVDAQNKENETPLQCAAVRGNLECVRVLLHHGASINLADKRKSTPLHLACRRRHTHIALTLLHAGCELDNLDQINETPLHPAAKEGLLPVVQTMSAFGCQMDVINKAGLSPLHLSSRAGHAEIVRCLLLSGAEPDLPNKDGVTAEIMALAHGHNEIAEMLIKLKPERRQICIKQLIPTTNTLSRIKLKLFGCSGVGKTTLMESLKCGYLGSFFRKARMGPSPSVAPKSSTENGVQRQKSLPTQLSFDVGNNNYTRGIDLQQVSISGAGDFSVWEFSGYEPYYMVYDHFIGDPNCIHIIVFKLDDSQHVQLTQVLFWLNFIKARIAPMEPIGQGGKHPWPAKIILVATHADKVNCTRNSKGEFVNPQADVLLATVQQKFETDFDIVGQVFITDAHQAMSTELKALRTCLGDVKSQVIQRLPFSNGFLDAVVAALPNWRKTMMAYQVVTWPSFNEYVRSKVNMLASEEHLKELVCQLQLIGEIIYVEADAEKDFVVLSPKWLCTDIIGQLLSYDRITHTRPTGCFTLEDFQLMFPEAEAAELLQVLEALEVCTECDIDGDIEYEFPCLNFVETLNGLWEKDDTRLPNPIYAGVRLQCQRSMTNQMMHLFPRLQVQLRREALQEESHGDDYDLYQWYHGSKFCNGSMESLITLELNEQVIDIKCRGPAGMPTELFNFMQDICDISEDMIDETCPGIGLEKLILSASDLKDHKESIHTYSPKDILLSYIANETNLTLDDNKTEDIYDLLCLGSEQIKSKLTMGTNLHVSNLNIHAKRQLSMLLDTPDPMGKDWCLLAVSLGLTDNLPHVDKDNNIALSKTARTLELCSVKSEATIRYLTGKLQELGREDAVDAMLTYVPLYRIDRGSDGSEAAHSPHSSDNTISSSVSR